MINFTVGLLGVFDVATSLGLEEAQEELGQVLGVWGVGTGPYLLLPALGPSDVRSSAGSIVDDIVIPEAIFSNGIGLGGVAIRTIEARAALMDQEETLERALGQSLFVRDAYFQSLAFEVNDGEISDLSDEQLQQDEDAFSEFEDLLNE